MDSSNLDVLKQCQRWLETDRHCQLVTVTKTWGSSPRPVGALLAIREDGLVVGSVSGGCIEDDLIENVRQHGIQRNLPDIVTYGITAEQAHQFGLPCGGTIQLVIEPLSHQSGITALLEKLAANHLVARHLSLRSGQVKLLPAKRGSTLQLRDDEMISIHGPQWRLLIIGAGELSRFLASVAVGLDYQVIVCDPREEYRDTWQVEGVQLMTGMPDDVVEELKLDARSAVVALTHDPKLDDLALMSALKSSAFYVGAIGSKHNNAKRRERLKLFDISDEELSHLHGPVGLFIGSKTPAEIAISILAEMTAVKNGVLSIVG